MNNSWGNEQYQMPNMMGIQPMMQNMMPPLLPPMCMMSEMTTMPPVNTVAPAPSTNPMIGPVIPEGVDISAAQDVDPNAINVASVEQNNTDAPNQHSGRQRGSSKENRDNRRDRERSRFSRHDHDRNDRGSRSDRDRNDRGDRYDRNRSDRDRRERRSKWDNGSGSTGTTGLGQVPGNMSMGNMMMTGGMLPYNAMNSAMNNMMGQQQMDMSGMQNMQNMSSMVPAMSMMSNQNMMPNLMGNMMDPNMLMMNQQMMPLMPNQPIYVTGAVLLPPIPGITMPNRRERPHGCRTIFVGGLPNGISEDIITETFQRFGDISDVKLHRQGVCHVRFEKQESVEQSFCLSGYRFKTHDQMENEATTLFIDYALNREDQNEYERASKRKRSPTPLRIEQFTPQTLSAISEKIKSDDQFAEAAPTLAGWLNRGECNKKNANSFYSLIQASNNQIRRLFNEKMALDEEYHNMKASIKDKFNAVVIQFEQVAKILTAAKHKRVSDHFTKQQRKNIEMWLKMTEEVDTIKEEFNANFDDEEIEKTGKNMVPAEKYEELKAENDSLMSELEGYKNEAYLAKDEAERKFEKFKAHFIAQQALQNNSSQNQQYPPLPPPPPIPTMSNPPLPTTNVVKPLPPPPTPDDDKVFTSGPAVPPTEAKLISILTAFLMVHPLGVSLDYLVSYVRSMVPIVTQATVQQVLQKYSDVFSRNTTGIGASIEHRWAFVTFDIIKCEK